MVQSGTIISYDDDALETWNIGRLVDRHIENLPVNEIGQFMNNEVIKKKWFEKFE